MESCAYLHALPSAAAGVKGRTCQTPISVTNTLQKQPMGGRLIWARGFRGVSPCQLGLVDVSLAEAEHHGRWTYGGRVSPFGSKNVETVQD